MVNKVNFLVIVLVIMLSLFRIHSQEIKGVRAVYAVNTIASTSTENEYERLVKDSKSLLSDFKFVLRIDAKTEKVIFYYDKHLISDSNKRISKMAMAIAKCNNIYYMDKRKNSYIKQVTGLGDIINVKSEIPVYDWSITSEKKEVLNGVFVYKATTKVPFTVNNSVKYSNVEAWFAPEFPYGFGPLMVNGLPGLILILKQDSLIYYIESLEILKDKNFEEITPLEADLVLTPDQFNTYVNKYVDEFFGRD